MNDLSYEDFLRQKTQLGSQDGFAPLSIPDFLFDFQQSLVDWAIRKGRAALFVDTGLGKTAMQLAWADNVVRKTNKPVLILTPLAVSFQTVNEAEKFGIEAVRSPDGKVTGARIYVTNYERLHYFDASQFGGVVCDESSRIKAFDAKTCDSVILFARDVPYRLLCTATAAPNDYMELGTSAEALGHLRRVEMLARFFAHDGGDTAKWRLKKHAARKAFWEWLNSWARAVRKPSDLGFLDDRFALPPLVETEHIVVSSKAAEGYLFPMTAIGLTEQRRERRNTLGDRCQKVADLVNRTGQPAITWCSLNAEGDLLEQLIPGAIQISGKDSDDAKEEKFSAFIKGQARVLITKMKIGAWGLNLQHCAHMTFFPSHSFEEYYQAVRRCYRFGQKRPVTVDIVTTEGEQLVLKNLQRKARQADQLFSSLTRHMGEVEKQSPPETSTRAVEMPSWI